MKSLVRACEILKAFRDESECLRLSDVAQRTGLHKATALRLIRDLVATNMLVRVGESKYKLGIRPIGKRRFRFGCGMQSAEFGFSRTVMESLMRSATAADIELLVLDNEDDANRAVRNANIFVREKLDLVIETQTHVRIAAEISSRFRAASIPVIAVEIPQPNAIYYGANNSQAGLIAGRHLARWAEANWRGKVDQLLLVDVPKVGQVPNARILVAAINDPCAVGALQGFRDAGREEHCAIVGQNASSDAHVELATKNSRLIGSVGYFPERYGEGVIPLALDLLAGRHVLPANFVRHEIITSSNLHVFYPN